MRKRGRGFTLIEILIAVAIVGIIAAAAIAPLVYTVIRVVDTEEMFNEDEALNRGISLIVRDIFETVRTIEGVTLRTVKKGILGAGDDFSVVIASASPTRQNLPAGSIVYSIVGRSMFSSLPEGLYRWVVPFRMPTEIDLEDDEFLKEEDAQLVLTDVKNLKAEILIPPDWSEEAYSGGLPVGIRLSLSRGENTVERIEWLPK